MSWHQTIIVGNLGGDPELRYMQNGRAVCNFSVAVSERWKDRQSNEQQERTTWYRVAVWGAHAENCNTYLAKGRQVLVIGNVAARGYMNNNGEAAASLDLTARNVQFLGGGNRDSEGYQGGGSQSGGRRADNPRDDRASNYTETPGSVDDIPF